MKNDNGQQLSLTQALDLLKSRQGKNFKTADVSLAELERLTGITRARLRRLKKNDFKEVPHGSAGKKLSVTVLSGYTGLIDNLLKQNVTNSEVCFERLKDIGYKGGKSTVKNYIAAHRHLVPAKRQLVSPQGNRGRRYFTGPGEAYQMDWGFVHDHDYSEIGTTQARAYGRSGRVITNLVKPSCLIIDEVGLWVFDKENTRMFFVDRRYNKEDPYTMIFTSNKQPSQWKQNFNEDDSLLCALDRIFDDDMIFNLCGNSYRGKECESYSLPTLRGKATNAVLLATN